METIITNVPRYQAIDGTIFNSENDCREYENNYEQIINRMFFSIPMKKISGDALDPDLCSDNIYLIIKPRDINDIIIINMIISKYSGISISMDVIDVPIVILKTYDNEYYYEGTVENKINNYINALTYDK